MVTKKNNRHALIGVTMKAVVRRWVASLLLVAVAAAGAFSAMVLQNLTVRQENALNATIANTTISCMVTDVKGTDSGSLQMPSKTVEMLEGKYRESEYGQCYLDDYVKNVRAMATVELDRPKGAELRRILSIDSDPALSPVEGASVQLYDGWTEEAFKGREQVCLVPLDMVTEDGFINITSAWDEPVRLKIIGTVTNGPGNVIYCPFYMPWEEGTFVWFYADRCSFDIQDNFKLEESREYIYQWFVEPKLSNQSDGQTFGVLVQDETYQKNIAEIQGNLSMLHLLLPVLIVLCGGIGIFASFLATRGRTKEFAVMRCIGMGKGRIFGLVMAELAVLALTGLLLGMAGGVLLEGKMRVSALLHAAAITGVFLLGSAIATLRITNVNVMQLMKMED